jgi:hypothetical protein
MNGHMKRFALVLAVMLAASPPLLLGDPALAQAPLRDRMVGIWFGSGQPGDQSQMYIDHFNADGSFRSEHRMCRFGKALDTPESGRWQMTGNILVIDIAITGGRQLPRTDRYRVNAADGKTQDYTYLANNFGYKARKVDSKFQMPPCDLSS